MSLKWQHFFRDQHEVDQLNDDIRRLKTENKKAFAERMRLEAQKNKLENLLTNNLNRRKDELVQALQEISVEDRKRQLENTSGKFLKQDILERSRAVQKRRGESSEVKQP